MEEPIFHTDGNIQITSTRIIIGNTTYALRNISSVRTFVKTPSRSLDVLLIIIGVFLALIGLKSSDSKTLLVFGIVLLGLGIFLFSSKKPLHMILLGTNSGEVEVLSNLNKDYIDSIEAKINEAIINYR